MKNIFNAPIPSEGEIFTSLLEHKNVKIECIASSDLILDKEYIQEQDEWVLLLKGHATLEVQGNVHELSEGDYVFIPSGQKHEVLKAEAGTRWLAVHIFEETCSK